MPAVIVSLSGFSSLTTLFHSKCINLSEGVREIDYDVAIVDDTEGSILANPTTAIWEGLKKILISGRLYFG